MYSFSPRILRGLKLFYESLFYLVQPANCAMLFFLAKMIAARIRIDREELE